MSVTPRVKDEPCDTPHQHEHVCNVAILRTGYVGDSSSSDSTQDGSRGLILHVDDDGLVETPRVPRSRYSPHHGVHIISPLGRAPQRQDRGHRLEW